jgi:hypothetical protein
METIENDYRTMGKSIQRCNVWITYAKIDFEITSREIYPSIYLNLDEDIEEQIYALFDDKKDGRRLVDWRYSIRWE